MVRQNLITISLVLLAIGITLAPAPSHAQPDLGTLLGDGDERWHPGLLDSETRYVLPSGVGLAIGENGNSLFQLTRFNTESIPGALTRNSDRRGTLLTHWSLEWPDRTPDADRHVEIIWSGLRTSNRIGSYLVQERSDGSRYFADTPLDRVELALFWGEEGKHRGLFGNDPGRLLAPRFFFVYAGRRRLGRTLDLTVDPERLSLLFKQRDGTLGVFRFVDDEVARFVASAESCGAVTIDGRGAHVAGRGEILAIFAALRRGYLQYDLRPVDAGVRTLVFCLRPEIDLARRKLKVEEQAAVEASAALTPSWPGTPLPPAEHRVELPFSLDGVPATQLVHFRLPPAAAAHRISVVKVEAFYEEPQRAYSRKKVLELTPEKSDATWSFQTRYSFEARLNYRVFVVQHGPGGKVRASGWMTLKSDREGWHFAIPEHFISLEAAVSEALAEPQSMRSPGGVRTQEP